MVLHQHEAAEFRSEMSLDPLWQWGQDRPPVRRHPAFALVTGRAYRNHEVLHQKGLVPLEAGSGRDLGLDHFLLNTDAGHDLAPAGPLRANNSETSTPREFNLEGAQGSSRS